MGRPRTPSVLKQIAGTDRADRRNGKEPEPDLLDDLQPPSHLDERAAVVWRQLAPMLRRAQVLTVMDVLALEMLCNAVADYRSVRQLRAGDVVAYSHKGSQMLDQHLVAELAISKRAEAFMAKFGMDPASRSRVMVDPQGDLFGKTDTPPQGAARFFQ